MKLLFWNLQLLKKDVSPQVKEIDYDCMAAWS